MSAPRPFWASFWSLDPSKWEYPGPWWVSTTREVREGVTLHAICCAVMAVSEVEAWAIIHAMHDDGHAPIDWRFMTDDHDPAWAPFSARFPRAAWMQWPFPLPLDAATREALDAYTKRGRPTAPEDLR